jgi:hypothetical protein
MYVGRSGPAGNREQQDERKRPFRDSQRDALKAEASLEQARKTFEKFLDSAKETAGSLAERNETMRAGAKDISAKAIAYAETNVQVSLDYAEKLLHAKDLPEMMRLHAEYVQAQMRARRAGQRNGPDRRAHRGGGHAVQALAG